MSEMQGIEDGRQQQQGFPGEMQRPDWVMLGIPSSDGRVVLMASKELTQAELSMEAEVDPFDWRLDPYRIVNPIRRYFVTAEMKTYVIIVANTYGAALTTLMRQWQPDQQRGQRPALPFGT